MIKLPTLPCNSATYIPAWGMEFVPKNSKYTLDQIARIRNAEKLIGYLLLGGCFIGSYRLAFVCKNKELTNKTSHVFRAFLEFFALGFTLIPLDYYIYKKEEKKRNIYS
jgi:hypothetical protein